MNKQIKETLVGGFIATIAMMIIIYLENVTHTFEINQPEFMQQVIVSSFWGWILIQFIVGWIFAFFYTGFFNRFMGFIASRWARGMVYGILLAVLVEIGIAMTDDGLIGESNMSMEIIGLILAYGTYGAVLGAWVQNPPQKTE